MARTSDEERPSRLPLTISQRIFLRPGAASGAPAEVRQTPAFHHLLGDFDVEAMRRALGELVDRYPILRTRLCWDDESAWQEPGDAAPSLAYEDLTGLPASEHKAEIWRRLSAAYQVAPDNAGGRMIRAWAFKLGEDDHVFGLIISHAVLDHRSTKLIIEKLYALYRSFVADLPLPPQDTAPQYADYVRATQSLHQPERLSRNLATWREKHGDVRPVSIRAPSVPAPAPMSQSAVIPFIVNEQQAQRVAAMAREEGLTLPMIMSGVVCALLSRWSGSPKVLIGCIMDGRSKEYEQVVGSFVRTSPLVIDLTGDPTVAELFQRARGAYIEAIDTRRIIDPYQIPGFGQVALNVYKKPAMPPRPPQQGGYGRASGAGSSPYYRRTHKEWRSKSSGAAGDPQQSVASGGGGADPAGGTSAAGAPNRTLRLAGWRSDRPLLPGVDLDLQIVANDRPNMIEGHITAAADRIEKQRLLWFASGIAELLNRTPDNLRQPLSTWMSPRSVPEHITIRTT